jgi:quinohemoprotein ethanol dehydrogenase
MGRSDVECQWPEKKSGDRFKFQIVFREISVVLALLGLSLCSSAWAQIGTDARPDRIKANIARVDSDFIRANTQTSKDWPTVGLDYAETRFSKLDQINTNNIKDLGLVWSYNLESSRGIEATPVVVDGIMYQSAPWSVVHAIDARTGKKSGRSIRMLTGQRAIGVAVTLSAVASLSTRAGYSWPPMTGA